MIKKVTSIPKPQPSHSLSGRLESLQEYEYLRANNAALSKEVANLRQSRAQTQTEINRLVKEKFEIETKYNELRQVLSKIEQKSKILMNKVVDTSCEITGIFHLLSEGREFPAIDPSSQIENCNNFDTVSRSQSGNGSIMNGSEKGDANSDNESQKLTNRLDTSTYEGEPDESEFTEVLSSFRSRRHKQLEELDIPGDQTIQSNEEVGEEEIAEEEREETEDEEEEDDEPVPEVGRPLSIILEDYEPTTCSGSDDGKEDDEEEADDEEEDDDEYNVKKKKNFIRRNKLIADESELEIGNSSVVAEASLSFDETLRFDANASLMQTRTNFPRLSTPRRKSLVERKSLGSPVPVNIRRRLSIPKRRSSLSSKVISTEVSETETTSTETYTDSPSAVKRTRKSMDSSTHINAQKRTMESTRRRSISSPNEFFTSDISEMSTIGQVQNKTSNILKNQTSHSTLENPDLTIKMNTLNNSIEKSSIHSTPLVPANKVSRRRERKIDLDFTMRKEDLSPFVQLTRLDLQEVNSSTKELSYRKLSKNKIKREKKTLGRTEFKSDTAEVSSPTDDIQKENVPIIRLKKSGDSNRIKSTSTGRKTVVKMEPSEDLKSEFPSSRPRRAAKPTNLKEPNCTIKLRRAR